MNKNKPAKYTSYMDKSGTLYCKCGNFDYVTIKRGNTGVEQPNDNPEIIIVMPTVQPRIDAVNDFFKDFGYNIVLRSTVNVEP